MNKLSICALVALLSLVAACKKDRSAGDTPTTTNTAKVAFSWDTIGAGEMVATLFQDPIASISGGTAGDNYTFEISCNNGLYYTDSTNYTGSGSLDSNGKATLYIPGLTIFKDGQLTLAVKFTDSTFTAKAIKQESIIRTYRDFMFMTYPRGGNTNNYFVQTADITFPDTTFSVSPGELNLFGTYDGQGHKISNFKLYGEFDPGFRSSIGLFKNAYSGSVLKNVRLELAGEGLMSTGRVSCGGLVGTGNSTKIINCSVKGDIMGSFEDISYFGGIIGYSQSDTIVGCSYRGSMQGAYCGGIAGDAVLNSTINMCYAYWTGDVLMGGGIMGVGGKGDKVINSYANMYDIAYSVGLYAVGRGLDTTALNNVLANTGQTSVGVIMLASTEEINTSVTGLTVNDWPVYITNAPADKKPYVLDGANDVPAKLWWE